MREEHVTNNLHRGRFGPVVAIVSVGVLVLGACGDDSDDSSSAGDSTSAESTTAANATTPADSAPPADAGSGPDTFSYFGQTQNTTIVGTLETLAANECATANAAAPLKADATDGATWDQQLQLVAGQGALSNMSMAAGTPSLMKEFIDAGLVLNISDALEELGVADKILPSAASTIKSLYDNEDMYALPTELNIEGFWYNKQMLTDNGIEPPATWDDLVAAAATLDAAGIQPFVAAGQDGWPVTRLVGDYIARSLGPDALQKVADGQAKLTDPEYVAAADEVAKLGDAGYFGDAPGSIDYNTAMNQFLTGGGAFFYMGSWAVSNFNDLEQNKIGVDNVGFAPFPAVDGGAGSIDQVPANAGIPVMFTTNNYGETTKQWLKCVVENYGDTVLSESGVVTGFAIDSPPADLSPLTKTVQDTINNAGGSFLWFEAAFTPEGTTVSQTNGGGLASGALGGQEFMELVQKANEG